MPVSAVHGHSYITTGIMLLVPRLPSILSLPIREKFGDKTTITGEFNITVPEKAKGKATNHDCQSNQSSKGQQKRLTADCYIVFIVMESNNNNSSLTSKLYS